jgi:hypothetical protein
MPKRQLPRDGFYGFEAGMGAGGRPAVLKWVTPGRPIDVELHAGDGIGPSFVCIQALREHGWRAYVAAPDNDAQGVIAALDERHPFTARASAAVEPVGRGRRRLGGAET